ncbi:SRPBCC family protein [Paenibacillus koleovorans]|uniref:SRPBCC family protein n=1 Tax=Paenibacillus koleovorans TaxID=121608 RepID=UPI0013E2B27F|nr:SRPBCC family protein [Paenibacillus koleovorans]
MTMLRKTFSFQAAITVRAPAVAIYDALLVAENHLRLHPLIVAVRRLNEGENPDAIRVEITDHIRVLGLFHVVKKYEASFTGMERGRRLTFETFTSPRIHVKSTITLSSGQMDGETRVEESVQVEAPALLVGFVRKQIVAAHGEMLAKLKMLMEE